eukprot:TRINITY_DN18900_c0_g1_i1.p1 TRINITY_DN18900_c0_g1~~TRINITY_DN18900_c0_g1_i1.p1  ORF type:complete len:382 (-),score=36.04 TRINITY_DN18900_c0_g1_i1:150-1295(-)
MSSPFVPTTDDQAILYINFSSDQQRYFIGTNSGYRVYSIHPYKEVMNRHFPMGGIGLIEQYMNTPVVALVGGGRKPCFQTDRIVLYNDEHSAMLGDLVLMDREIWTVRFNKDLLFVGSCDNTDLNALGVLQIYKFDSNTGDTELQWKYPTAPVHNLWNSLISTATTLSGTTVLAYPTLSQAPPGHPRNAKPKPSPTATKQGEEDIAAGMVYDGKGLVHIVWLTTMRDKRIEAHDSTISNVCLSSDGNKLLTTSWKGTLIRVFDANSGMQLKEFRRGSERATVYSLCFSPTSDFIACSSDKGTIHVFSMGNKNRKSMFSFLSGLSSYAGSEWSFAWYHGQPEAVVCSFGDGPADNHVALVYASGSFLQLPFNKHKGGQMIEA